ncbi:MAG TPA: tetratricopeptide repeat protein [Nitrospirae bacterium]|nr:tetratricopeptide repeat protein [Nitrospirota bacterium]
MPLESYKKWTAAIIIAAAAGVVIVSLILTPSYRTEETAGGRTDVTPTLSGPLMDRDANKVIPLENLGVDIDNPQSLALLGDKYFETGRYIQAIEIYKKVLELSPNDVDTYNDLGLAYHYTGNPELAVDTLKKGTELMPSHQRIWLSLGYVLMSGGKNQEARQALEKAAELNPETDVGQEASRMIGLLK